MPKKYKFIVVGCGGIGSAACYWLSRLHGSDVLGIEQFALDHGRGESDDHSRIIRLSYHSPVYTALAPSAYEAWHEVEAEAGLQLVFKTGGLDLDSDIEYLKGLANAMDVDHIPYQWLSPAEVMQRWPQFRLPKDISCLYQADSGLVDARQATATHISLAKSRGATILPNTQVQSIQLKPDSALVTTTQGVFEAEKLIIASGPWTNQVLKPWGITLPLAVTQEQVTYYKTPHLDEFSPDRFPVWLWHYGASEHYYGLPVYGEAATKAGIDLGGKSVTANTRSFEPDQRMTKELYKMLSQHIPNFLGPVHYTKTCLYTLTPDRDFVLDTIPGNPNVAVVVGAGHAFKFASLLGRILSQMIGEEDTTYPIQAFKIDRPALTDTNFKPTQASLHFTPETTRAE